MMGLTPKQRDCLDFLRSYIAERGVAPSQEEISAALGMKSKSAATQFLDALESRGHINRLPGKARAIEIVSDNPVLAIFPADIRRWIEARAREAGVQPETIIRERMRELAEHERAAREVA